jgi:sugar lactone lactonase YvrE
MAIACGLAVLAAFCGPVFPELPPPTSPPRQLIALGGGHPGRMALAGSGLWVAVYPDGSRGRVVRVDPDTGRVTARIPVRGSPFSVAARGGAVWVTGSRRERDDVLYRIDPRTNRVVATIPLPGYHTGAIAITRHGLWVLTSNRAVTRQWLVRVDAANQVVSRAPLALVNPDQLTTGRGFVWLVALRLARRGELPGDVLRFEPRENWVTARIPARASSVAIGKAGMWLTGCVRCSSPRRGFNFAQQVDPRALRVVGPRIAVRGGSFGPLSVGAGSVWFGGYDGRERTVAFSLDPGSGRVERLVRAGDDLHSGMALDRKGHVLWVSRAAGGVLRVDLAQH